jgi:hypothetical protein
VYCCPSIVLHHRSPASAPPGATAEIVRFGVRVTSFGPTTGTGGGGTTLGIAGTTATADGWVCTHVALDGPMYQTYSRPVVVLNQRSPSAGEAGGVGAFVTVGNHPSMRRGVTPVRNPCAVRG